MYYNFTIPTKNTYTLYMNLIRNRNVYNNKTQNNISEGQCYPVYRLPYFHIVVSECNYINSTKNIFLCEQFMMFNVWLFWTSRHCISFVHVNKAFSDQSSMLYIMIYRNLLVNNSWIGLLITNGRALFKVGYLKSVFTLTKHVLSYLIDVLNAYVW